jgi:predicted ABC-type ATPase
MLTRLCRTQAQSAQGETTSRINPERSGEQARVEPRSRKVRNADGRGWKDMPKVIVFAGANGSGKSTLAATLLERGLPFINADEIKKREKLSFIDAGNAALERIDSRIFQRKDFAFETTMSGLGLLRRFQALKKQRCEIIIYYLFAQPVELLIERVAERVKKGGHAVSREDIIRRYYRSLANFWFTYKSFAGEWFVNDNNDRDCRNIIIGSGNSFEVVDIARFADFKEALNYAGKK